jgi:hypothetical protein
VVQVVRQSTIQDLHLLKSRELDNTLLEQLLRSTTLDTNEIVDVIETIKADLCSYDALYRDALLYMQNGPDRTPQIRDLLAGPRHNSSDIHFVLHDEIDLWSVESATLCELVIEERKTRDDRFALLVLGFLVSTDRAFESSLALLDAAFSEQWPCWESLWNWF